jgi:hypothetical protein
MSLCTSCGSILQPTTWNLHLCVQIIIILHEQRTKNASYIGLHIRHKDSPETTMHIVAGLVIDSTVNIMVDAIQL